MPPSRPTAPSSRLLPELSFSLVFIGARRQDYADSRYALPKNVLHMEKHYLEDAYAGYSPARVHLPERKLEATRDLHEYLASRASKCPMADAESGRLERAVDAVLTTLERKDGVSAADFLFGSASWEFIRQSHLAGDASASFIDYFWTVRILHGPMFQLARMARTIARA